jgi:AraC-like DNA-binding protein
MRGLPPPEHPLVSVVDLTTVKNFPPAEPMSLVYDFYAIFLKKKCNANFRYGQQQYDFDSGTMFFMAPNQVLGIEPRNEKPSKQKGWMLLLHPDFLWNTPLAASIRQYEYFDYAVNEALFLAEKEEAVVTDIVRDLSAETRGNMDAFTQRIVIAQLELLLSYADRFYHRQFLTRKISSHKMLGRLEELLTDYFENETLLRKGLPTVSFVAESLNVSPNYLSGLLKVLTGQSTLQHIHAKVIEKAKEKLSTSELSVSEIAYELGFEYPQSFSKLFKAKTQVSPQAFRESFN